MEVSPLLLYAMYFLLITAGAGMLYLVAVATAYFPRLIHKLAQRGKKR